MGEAQPMGHTSPPEIATAACAYSTSERLRRSLESPHCRMREHFHTLPPPRELYSTRQMRHRSTGSAALDSRPVSGRYKAWISARVRMIAMSHSGTKRSLWYGTPSISEKSHVGNSRPSAQVLSDSAGTVGTWQ